METKSHTGPQQDLAQRLRSEVNLHSSSYKVKIMIVVILWFGICFGKLGREAVGTNSRNGRGGHWVCECVEPSKMHQILPINVSQRAAALHDFTLFSDKCKENIHFLHISTICKTNTEITFTKQITTTWKRTQKNSVIMMMLMMMMVMIMIMMMMIMTSTMTTMWREDAGGWSETPAADRFPPILDHLLSIAGREDDGDDGGGGNDDEKLVMKAYLGSSSIHCWSGCWSINMMMKVMITGLWWQFIASWSSVHCLGWWW